MKLTIADAIKAYKGYITIGAALEGKDTSFEVKRALADIGHFLTVIMETPFPLPTGDK